MPPMEPWHWTIGEWALLALVAIAYLNRIRPRGA